MGAQGRWGVGITAQVVENEDPTWPWTQSSLWGISDAAGCMLSVGHLSGARSRCSRRPFTPLSLRCQEIVNDMSYLDTSAHSVSAQCLACRRCSINISEIMSEDAN